MTHGFLRARHGTMTTYDVPRAGTDFFQGTFDLNVNPAGVIAGYYVDESNAHHGFLRARDGTITTFDAPDAGTASGQGTTTASVDGINPAGAIAGYTLDASNVNHGFLRAPDGTFNTFDVPGGGITTFDAPGDRHRPLPGHELC